MPPLRLALLLLVLAALLAAAGCGGDDEGSPEAWASSVCGSVNDWADEVDAALESVTEQGLALEEGDVRDAVDQVGEATEDLGNALDDLGPPETESGQAAQEELETLRDDIREQVDELDRALGRNPEPLQAVAAVATALAAAARGLQEGLDSLEGLDPGGELADAFESSEDCDALRERIENAGS